MQKYINIPVAAPSVSGWAGRELVLQAFSARAMVDGMVAVYERLVREGTRDGV